MDSCPHCDHPLPDTACASCGLWWLAGGVERIEPEPVEAPSRVLLRARVGCGWYLVFGGFAALGGAAASTSLDRLLAHPDRLVPWLTALVGIPLGGWVALMCAAGVASWALETLVPTRLDLTDAGLRFRCWRSWSGAPASFRRTDVTFAPGELDAVGFSTTQGGQPLIAFHHRSGRWVGTPWSGPRPRAEPLAAALAALLSSARATAG